MDAQETSIAYVMGHPYVNEKKLIFILVKEVCNKFCLLISALKLPSRSLRWHFTSHKCV
jgi:hypothetical protein